MEASRTAESFGRIHGLPACMLRPVSALRLIALVVFSTAVSVSADAVAGATEQDNQLRLSVGKIVVQDFPMMNALKVELGIDLQLRNGTNEPIQVSSEQIRLQANGKDQRTKTTAPLGRNKKTIAAGESMKITAVFDVEFEPTREPRLLLTWATDDKSLEVDLNREIRSPGTLQTILLGPKQQLAVVRLNRPLDNLTLWMVDDEVKRLHERKIDRLVLDIHAEASGLSPVAMRSTATGWVNSLRRGQPTQRFVFGTRLQASVKFAVVYFSWPSVQSSRIGSGSFTGDLLQPSREHAIAKALQTAYNGIPVADALADLRHDEPGVRRAAVQANIDRLTLSELQNLIADAVQNSPEILLLIAENLHRVPHPEMSEQLMAFCLSDQSELANAAIRSLVRMPADSAVTQVRELWHRWDTKPDQRESLADTILAEGDHRYSDQILAFAGILLDRYSRPDPADMSPEGRRDFNQNEPEDSPEKDEVGGEEAGKAEANFDIPRVSNRELSKLRSVLDYLSEHAPEQLRTLSRQRVLRLAEPRIQDAVIHHILTQKNHEDSDLVHAYILQRLPNLSPPDDDDDSILTDEQKAQLSGSLGPREGASRSDLTRELMRTIRTFPDTRYTDQLLILSQSKAISGTIRNEAFQSAIACASSRQLSTIIEAAARNTSEQNSFLLRHLQQHQHPGWLQVARVCLAGDESEQLLAAPVLVTSGSAEGLQLVIDRLNELRREAEDGEGLSARNFRVVKKIISLLAGAPHPEARRAINHCAMSGELSIAEEARKSDLAAIETFHRTTPYSESIAEAYQLSKVKQYEEAIAVMTTVLENEPFFHQGLEMRASWLMRVNQHAASVADLDRAVTLNPDDPNTELIRAIAMVRIRRVADALELTDRILAQIPDVATLTRRDALYNAACVYARAIAETEDPDLAEQYLQTGMELLTESVSNEKGFDDLDHFLNDDDLTVFHAHGEWEKLVELVRVNEANNPGR